MRSQCMVLNYLHVIAGRGSLVLEMNRYNSTMSVCVCALYEYAHTCSCVPVGMCVNSIYGDSLCDGY